MHSRYGMVYRCAKYRMLAPSSPSGPPNSIMVRQHGIEYSNRTFSGVLCMNAAAYIRVSTDDQIEFSPSSQLSHIRTYAEHHNLLLPGCHIYVDEGISGRTAAKRPAFLKMIAAARETPRPFDVILVWKYSRFSRSRQDSIFYKSLLRRECGIDVISVTEPLSDDPTSILMEALLEAMDEYYSVNLGQEVRRGMQEKFKRGGVVSIPPFGYQVVDGQFVPDQVQAPCISLIYQRFLSGSTCSEIAHALNASGIRTSRGNSFDGRSVRYILTNPFYTGILRRQTHPSSAHDHFYQNTEMTYAKGIHTPLISQTLFKQVQQKLKTLQTDISEYF